nr:hypothetical protein [Escherichia coli]
MPDQQILVATHSLAEINRFNIISASTESFKIINPCSIHNVVPLLLSVFTANGSRNSVAVLRPPAVAARPSLC